MKPKVIISALSMIRKYWDFQKQKLSYILYKQLVYKEPTLTYQFTKQLWGLSCFTLGTSSINFPNYIRFIDIIILNFHCLIIFNWFKILEKIQRFGFLETYLSMFDVSFWNSNCYSTHLKSDFLVPRINTVINKMIYFYSILWTSNLDGEIKYVNSLEIFKNKIRMCRYSITDLVELLKPRSIFRLLNRSLNAQWWINQWS